MERTKMNLHAEVLSSTYKSLVGWISQLSKIITQYSSKVFVVRVFTMQFSSIYKSLQHRYGIEQAHGSHNQHTDTYVIFQAKFLVAIAQKLVTCREKIEIPDCSLYVLRKYWLDPPQTTLRCVPVIDRFNEILFEFLGLHRQKQGRPTEIQNGIKSLLICVCICCRQKL